MSKKMWIAVGLLIAALVLVGVIIAIASPFNSTKVKAATVERRTLDLSVSASGKVAADKKTYVSSVQSGRASVIYVKEGDVVQAGSPLLSLEADNLNLAVEQASINVDIAGSNEQNAKASKRIGQSNLDKVEAGASSDQLVVSNATLNQARAGVDAADQAITDIQSLNESSLVLAENAVQQAQAGYTAAQQAAEDALEQLTEAQSIPLSDLEIMSYESVYHQAESASQTARLALDGADMALENTRRLNDQVLHGAQAQAQTAQKTYDLILAQYNLTKAGASNYDLDILESQLTIAKNQYKAAQSQTELARLNLEGTQLQLDNATITSPIAGLVAGINVKEGELVTPGVPGAPPVAIVIDTTSLKFLANADETDITKVKIGQTVKITLDAYPERTFSGKILMTGITPVPTEGGAIAYSVNIAFDQKSVSGLREGMNGDADIVIGKVSDVLVIPASAVLDEEGRSYAFIIGSDNKLVKKEIKLGQIFEEFFEVTGGLDEGQRIVESDVKDLKEGEKVTW